MMLESFADNEVAGLLNKDFISSKVIYDGAIPSGNSVAVFNLLRLGHMTAKGRPLPPDGCVCLKTYYRYCAVYTVNGC